MPGPLPQAAVRPAERRYDAGCEPGRRAMFRRLLRPWPLVLGGVLAAAGYWWPQQPVWRMPLPDDANMLGFNPAGDAVMVFEGQHADRPPDAPQPRPPALVHYDPATGAETRRLPVPDSFPVYAVHPLAGGKFLRASPSQNDNAQLFHADTLAPVKNAGARPPPSATTDDGSLGVIGWGLERPIVFETATGREVFRVAEPPPVPAGSGEKEAYAHHVEIDGAGRRLAVSWNWRPGLKRYTLEIVEIGTPGRRIVVPWPEHLKYSGFQWHDDALVVDSEQELGARAVARWRCRVDGATGIPGPQLRVGTMDFQKPDSFLRYYRNGDRCIDVANDGTYWRYARDWAACEAWRHRAPRPADAALGWLAERVPALRSACLWLSPLGQRHVSLFDRPGKIERWRSPWLCQDPDYWDFSRGGAWYVQALPAAPGSFARCVECYSTAGRWRWPWLLAAPLGFMLNRWLRRRTGSAPR